MSIWAEVVISIHKTVAVEVAEDETLGDAEDHVIAETMEDNVEIVSSYLATSDEQAESFLRHSCKVKENHYIGDELTCDFEIDKIDGELLDTRVSIDGEFWVGGSERIEFKEKLEALITQYRI